MVSSTPMVRRRGDSPVVAQVAADATGGRGFITFGLGTYQEAQPKWLPERLKPLGASR